MRLLSVTAMLLAATAAAQNTPQVDDNLSLLKVATSKTTTITHTGKAAETAATAMDFEVLFDSLFDTVCILNMITGEDEKVTLPELHTSVNVQLDEGTFADVINDTDYVYVTIVDSVGFANSWFFTKPPELTKVDPYYKGAKLYVAVDMKNISQHPNVELKMTLYSSAGAKRGSATEKKKTDIKTVMTCPTFKKGGKAVKPNVGDKIIIEATFSGNNQSPVGHQMTGTITLVR